MFNSDHLHLRSFRYPNIAVMWARSGFSKQGRQVIGTTEKVMINAGGWKKELLRRTIYPMVQMCS